MSDFCSSLEPQFLFDGPSSKALDMYNSMPTQLLLPIITLNTSVHLVKWIVRFRMVVMRMTEWMASGCDTHESNATVMLQQDFDKSCDSAAAIIDMVFAMPKSHTNFYWFVICAGTDDCRPCADTDRYLEPLPVYAFHILFAAIMHNPASTRDGHYMELMSMVVESTVSSAGSVNPLFADAHLTHFLTFFARTARLAIRNAKSQRNSSISGSAG